MSKKANLTELQKPLKDPSHYLSDGNDYSMAFFTIPGTNKYFAQLGSEGAWNVCSYNTLYIGTKSALEKVWDNENGKRDSEPMKLDNAKEQCKRLDERKSAIEAYTDGDDYLITVNKLPEEFGDMMFVRHQERGAFLPSKEAKSLAKAMASSMGLESDPLREEDQDAPWETISVTRKPTRNEAIVNAATVNESLALFDYAASKILEASKVKLPLQLVISGDNYVVQQVKTEQPYGKQVQVNTDVVDPMKKPELDYTLAVLHGFEKVNLIPKLKISGVDLSRVPDKLSKVEKKVIQDLAKKHSIDR
jgi:hypothetical protein